MTRALLLGAVLGLALAAFSDAAAAHEGHEAPPGAGLRAAYAFPIAAPGTYRLPPIKPALGGPVIDDRGGRNDLRDLLLGRTTVLAFIYTRCGDVCPLATLGMARLQDLAAKDPGLFGRMRLITVSFDPEHDTPAVMREYAAQWRSADQASPEWLFLTAPDQDTIAPVLAAYNQRVDRNPAPASPGAVLNHIFRAFVIDPKGMIRNVYSLDFFDPELVINDVRTLLLERSASEPAAKSPLE